MSLKASQIKWGYIFVLPGLIWYLLFMAYPMYYSIVISTQFWFSATAEPVFVGLRNFRELSEDPLFWKSVINTFVFTLVAVPLSTFPALLIAILFTRIDKLRGLFRTLYFLPSVVGVSAAGIIWDWCYQPTFGLFNQILRFFGIHGLRWILDPKLALFCVALTHSWMRLGLNIVIFLAGLLNIPEEFYEAAKVDGASNFRQTIHITIPLIRPVLSFLLIYNTIYALTAFGEVYMLTEGGPANSTTITAFLMYETAFRYSQMGKGAAMGLLLFLLVLVITVVQMRFSEKGSQVEF